MHKGIATAERGRNELTAPDLSHFSTECFWRTNLETGYREHVRKRDGFVFNRIRLTPQQFARAKAAEPRKEPKMNQKKSGGVNLTGQRFGLLVSEGKGERSGYEKVLCDCGVRKEVLRSSLTLGRTKSCGHKRTRQKRPEMQPQVPPEVSPPATVTRLDPSVAIRPAPSHVDFRRVADAIEGVIKVAGLIQVGEVEALIGEIGRLEAALPQSSFRGVAELRGFYSDCRQTAESFLTWRSQLG